MAFCKNCGTSVDEDAKFCNECGSPTGKNEGESDEVFKTSLKQSFSYGNLNIENIEKGYLIDERYLVEKKIGQGGFGAVYKVDDKNLGQKKALKVLPNVIINDRESMDFLRNEASIMAGLNHPNIVRIYDFHEKGEIKYIDMEFVEGKTLTDIKLDSPEKKLDENQAGKYALQIAKGLSYAHSKNVIHRDIKPQNILVSKENEIKIMDFGISETVRTSMSRLENTGTSGTLVYMSPEQMMGENVGREADIYSFGILFYELLTGHPPFHTGAIDRQILEKEPEKIDGISGELNNIILKCLRKNYKERFRSFDEVLKALNGEIDVFDFSETPETLPDVTDRPDSKNNKSFLIAALVLIIFVIAGGLYFFTGKNIKPAINKPVKKVAETPPVKKAVKPEKPVKNPIEETKEKIASLDSEIKDMKKRLNSGNTIAGDGLDRISGLVSEKRKLAAKLSSLIKMEKEKAINALKKDIEKYKNVVNSKEGKIFVNAAWESLVKKYPERAKGVIKGDTAAFFNGGRLYIKTTPENADIIISGTEYEYSDGIKLEPKEYKLKVSARNYEDKIFNIIIDPGEEINKKVELVPFGSLTIS